MKILLATLLCISLVLAQDPPAPRPHKPAKRTFNINVEDHSLRIRATYHNDTYEDEFNMQVQLGNGDQKLVNFHFTYNNNNGGNHTHIDMQYAVINIIEFFSSDSQTTYQGDENVIFSTWPEKQDKLTWNGWGDEGTVVNGINTYKYTVSNQIFSLGIQMAASEVGLSNGLTIDPNSIKIDIGIGAYPYGLNPPFSTRLALHATVDSKTVSKNAGSKAIVDHKLVFDSAPDAPLGAISWIPSADITGTTTSFPVVAWSPETQKGNKFDVYYTFVTPSDNLHPVAILWDPRLGLDYETDPTPDFCIATLCGITAYAIVAAAGAVGLIIIVVIIALVVRRNRKSSVDYMPVNTF